MTGAASLRNAGIASERAGSLGIALCRSRSLEIARRSCCNQIGLREERGGGEGRAGSAFVGGVCGQNRGGLGFYAPVGAGTGTAVGA